jgi:hypothetical protein
VATRLKNKGLVNYRRKRYEVIPRLLDLFLEQATPETLRID